MNASRSQPRQTRFNALMLILCLLSLGTLSSATPPEYKTILRDQMVSHSINEQDMLRIWIVFIGQGDGILIQLPESLNYDLDPDDDDPALTERIDILIDGGSSNSTNSTRMGAFVEELYSDESGSVIEHAVITHHDQDHATGLTNMLVNSSFRFGHIYHNGLASYRSTAPRFSGGGKMVKNSPRTMAHVIEHADGRKTLDKNDLINTSDDLRNRMDEFQSRRTVYRKLAEAVVDATDEDALQTFDRTFVGVPFIQEHQEESGSGLGNVSIELLWPQKELLAYGGRNWGETINGNSLTFKLTYGDFEMFFTGDHNNHSQEEFIATYEADDPELSVLDCDVLKVPHHGSKFAIEKFFRRDNEHRRPVVSVASMGEGGFKVSGHKHPSEEVIKWLGGSHRMYSTFIHERRFKWDDMEDTQARADMLEKSHILIETDGTWFRIVEVHVDDDDPTNPPTVQDTRRGDGTRWINAKPKAP